MEVAEMRPKLVSFRATAFHGENKSASSGNEPWNIELTQTIEVGLATAQSASAPLLAVVKFDLVANATKAGASDQVAEFKASYEAKFEYPTAVTEEKIIPIFAQEPYQYLLIAQAFPLAMTHFRREMQAMGFDARELPLGI
jgi:hypothetical protein